MIQRGELRLPEMQREYVWRAPRVRDLVDSLYRGYKVTAAVGGSKKPRRDEGRRVEKSVLVDRQDITLSGGSVKALSLFARAGAVGIGDINDQGEPEFVELKRVKTYRRGKPGQFRWYNDYELPDAYEKQVITVRLHGNKEDAARKFNRTENVRPIAASDPDFKALYRRRNDAESINRGLVDSLYLGRAHSVGHARQACEPSGLRLDGQRPGASSTSPAPAGRAGCGLTAAALTTPNATQDWFRRALVLGRT